MANAPESTPHPSTPNPRSMPPQGLPTSVTPEPEVAPENVGEGEEASVHSASGDDAVPDNRPFEPEHRNKPHRGEDWGSFGHDEPPRRGTH